MDGRNGAVWACEADYVSFLKWRVEGGGVGSLLRGFRLKGLGGKGEGEF